MSLKTLFSEQIDQLRSFMDDPKQTMRTVRYEPDVEPLLEKILVKLDDDDDNPHVIVVCRSSCQEKQQYLRDLLDELAEQNERHREGLKGVDVELPSPVEISETHSAYYVLEKYISDVADCMPTWSGSYVVAIYPKEIANEADFKLVMDSLAQHTRSELAKYLVFDRQTEPILADITEQTERASVQVFEFSPDEIESRVQADLASGRLKPQERRQYTAMVGAFAMGQRKYDEAETAQLQAIQMAQEDGANSDEASSLYNLGNTYLAQDKTEQAEESYSRCIELGVHEEMHGLVAMALTNLGIVLQRNGHVDEAMESLDVAQQTFQAIQNPPGEAYALDNKAQVLYREGQHEEAEQAWLEAIGVYDGIKNEMFSKVRDTGREDICDKLKKFYKATDQADKIRQLEQKA